MTREVIMKNLLDALREAKQSCKDDIREAKQRWSEEVAELIEEAKNEAELNAETEDLIDEIDDVLAFSEDPWLIKDFKGLL
jgi:vacuolar-type H+-ATPase subunit H